MPVPTSLQALEADLARDLRLLNYPPNGWVPEACSADGRPVSDAIVAGGGMLGLTVAFALRRQGIANLTFRAWYEAQYGAASLETLGKIPRAMWMDYLIRYRHVLGLPVENGVRLAAIRPAAHGLDLDLIHADGRTEMAATRKLILATGREGQARPRLPHGSRLGDA
tara:strand:+ start:111 stop:611 length:501 start_codon:yes stop_codon:yes gene_type:complete